MTTAVFSPNFPPIIADATVAEDAVTCLQPGYEGNEGRGGRR